jgi:hypothetical protein
MSIIQTLRTKIRSNHLLRKIVAYYIVPSGIFDQKFLKIELGKKFKNRIDEVVSCPDNKYIHRVFNAGKVNNGKQILHNGLRINLGSYYGPEVAQQLFANKGVHEPQEEYVFQEVLKFIPPNATMIELGSFWSFYSMWFQLVIKGAQNFMVEPDPFNLGCGIRNFKLNKMKGDFTKAYVGTHSYFNSTGERTIGIDDYCLEKKINFIDILHSDIQGFEFEMLKGATKMLKEDKIGYFFISTHSNEIHYQCLNFLKEKDFIIVASADLNQTYAEDGLLVAKSKNYSGIERVTISLK